MRRVQFLKRVICSVLAAFLITIVASLAFYTVIDIPKYVNYKLEEENEMACPQLEKEFVKFIVLDIRLYVLSRGLFLIWIPFHLMFALICMFLLYTIFG